MFYLGLGLYLISFFLPAVKERDFHTTPGWSCAFTALWDGPFFRESI